MVNHPRRNRKAAVVQDLSVRHDHEAEYPLLRQAIISAAKAIPQTVRLFRTDASGLFDLFLNSLPEARQVHNCTACRRFMKEYGNLVLIADDGNTIPAFWHSDAVPMFYQPAVAAIGKVISKAKVTAPFLSSDLVWGIPITGDWAHMALPVNTTPASAMWSGRASTAKQAMAAKREDYRTVATALSEFTPEMLREALRLLEAETLAQSERFIGPVKWLLGLHAARKATKGPARDNLLWKAIASAPDGYCHPRASVVGTLLEDIAAGMSFADVKARFNAKMHPLRYQRPQAAPSAGNIKAAEALVEKLGIAPSLERRFARLNEIQAMWKPAPVQVAAGEGVFGHLKPKGATAPAIELPTLTMTWEKFARTILPSAEAIDAMVPAHGNFLAYLSAVHLDAPPILKWDREDARNPVSHYVYNGGSPASRWCLIPGWRKVTAVCGPPATWGENPMEFLGKSVTFILDGAVDSLTGQGNALFPETLKADLHAVRSTIEAYSRSASIAGRETASACGLAFDAGMMVRCMSSGHWTSYRLDRWD